MNRGTLNGTKTAISGTPNWTEDFTYDPIGNWDNYLTKVSGVTDLDQERTHNTANETVEIDGSTATVGHDLAGNMVKVPQVADWSSTNGLKWDAWNRLVSVKAGSTTVAEYSYDGLTRRVTKETGATRHYYYSDQWQILEESIDDETTAERQFIWGQRYLDDLVLRDRDVDHDGSLDERLYALSDYFNPTAIADEDGVVVERYGYNAFGLSRVMDADFGPRSSSDFDWETRYGAYRWDGETGFYQVRYRYLHPTLGRWLSRDPIEEKGGCNLFAYIKNQSVNSIDRYGMIIVGFYGAELPGQFPNSGNVVMQSIAQSVGASTGNWGKGGWPKNMAGGPDKLLFNSTAIIPALDYLLKQLDTNGDGVYDPDNGCDTKQDIKIFGWSWGGVSAVDLARQIRSSSKFKNKEVAFIGVIDPVTTGRVISSSKVTNNVKQFWNRYQTKGADLAGIFGGIFHGSALETESGVKADQKDLAPMGGELVNNGPGRGSPIDHMSIVSEVKDELIALLK